MSALFALAAAVGWGSSDFAAGYASRKSSATSVVILTHLASVIVLVVFALDIGLGGVGIDGSPTSIDLAWGLAAGVAGGAGAMLLFRGLGKGSMAVVAPITATGAAAIPVLFGLITGDAVTVFGIAGIALALVAIVLVSLTGGDDDAADDPNESATGHDPFTVPDDWSSQFRLPAPTGEPGGFGHASGSNTAYPPPPSATPPHVTATFASTTTLAPAAGASTTEAESTSPVHRSPYAVDRSAEPVLQLGIDDGVGDSHPDGDPSRELSLPLATVRQAVLALVGTAVLSAAAIASQPTRRLLDGEEFSGAVMLQLVFSLVIVGLAAYALSNVKRLFDLSELGLRRTVRVAASIDADEHPAPVASPVTAPATAPTTTTTTTPTATAIPTATPSGVPAPASVDAPAGLSWKSIVGQPGVSEALFSGVGFGLFFVFIYRASEAAGHWPLVSARGISVVMFCLIALGTRTSLLPERGSRRPVILAGVLDAAAAVLFVLSTRTGLLSVGAVLAALYPVVTVLLARVITKERIRPQQMVGLGLALGAVALLAI